ncbi:MAG: hypothetical protein GC155_14795 [Alphaproteobacteria bacterium]|nr:hypothetical protein [Alphaproteobacteria bacterium]
MKTNWKTEWKPLALIAGLFLACFYLPVGVPRFDNAVTESFELVKWYAREHVILCLVPAFFIAGAIGVFVSQASVMKYLGPKANKALAYGVASVSGTILAVCSCTVLPLFAGIWRMGAGLGPATAFLYSGPAINVLAIVLTARVLGLKLGIARAVGAVVFSVVIGLLMHWIFRKEELAKAEAAALDPEPEVKRPLWQNVIYFGCMVGILVFANWGKPMEDAGLWHALWLMKWPITAACAVGLAVVMVRWFGVKWWKMAVIAVPAAVLAFLFPQQPMIPFVFGVVGLSVLTSTSEGEAGDWFASTWTFAKQITPLLLFGVLAAGFFLGRPGKEGVIPSEWVTQAVGGNSLRANVLASVVGAFMYFATLTEVPILQGLIGSGMGQGPALALLLAGPALSLQSMLVLRTVMGTKKTVVYVSLVIVMASITGLIYGAIVQ